MNYYFCYYYYYYYYYYVCFIIVFYSDLNNESHTVFAVSLRLVYCFVNFNLRVYVIVLTYIYFMFKHALLSTHISCLGHT